MTALHNTLTADASADADIWHGHKSGTLAGRPAAAKAGRLYLTTDTLEAFWDNGTIWRHLSGFGAHDGFTRGDSTTITPSVSGHVWTEAAGDWQILSNSLRLVGAATAIATLDTGARLDRAFKVFATFVTQATVANIDIGVVLKFVDTSNYLYARLSGTALEIIQVVAGVPTTYVSQAFTPGASTPYYLEASVYGGVVMLSMTTNLSYSVSVGARNAAINGASLASATKIGCRLLNTLDVFSSINVQF